MKSDGRAPRHVFPPGARVLIDGRDEAIVRESFPEGSTFYLFPHYRLDVVGGDKGIKVNMARVGVKRAATARTKERR